MTRAEILEELRGILISAGEENRALAESCTDHTRLVADFGLTSVGILYIVIAIEETFGIRFGDMSISDFETVGNVLDYIEKSLK